MKVTVRYLPSVRLYSVASRGISAVRASRVILRSPRHLGEGLWSGELESADFDGAIPHGSPFDAFAWSDCNPGYVAAAIRLCPGYPLGNHEPMECDDMAYFRNVTRRRGPAVHTFNSLTMTDAESARATY